MILGPNDPRAYKDTGKTWTDSTGREHPIMLDPQGNEVKVVQGSMADFDDPDFADDLAKRMVEAGMEDPIAAIMQELDRPEPEPDPEVTDIIAELVEEETRKPTPVSRPHRRSNPRRRNQ